MNALSTSFLQKQREIELDKKYYLIAAKHPQKAPTSTNLKILTISYPGPLESNS